MKIDFTKFESPIDGLDLSCWSRIGDLEHSSEDIADASEAGIELPPLDPRYEMSSCDVDFSFTPEHRIVMHAASVIADLRAAGSLRGIRIGTGPLSREAVFEEAMKIATDWNLHAIESGEQLGNDQSHVKVDAVPELIKWKSNPPDTHPSFSALTEANLYAGIWIIGVNISLTPERDNSFELSAYVIWRDPEIDNENYPALN